MTLIYLTSFKRSGELPSDVERWSAAVYQPKGFVYPKAGWTDIRGASGEWIRPRLFIDTDNPPARYRQALLDLYANRILEASAWLGSLQGHAALCCWCPYDKAAQRQLGEWGSFICHTAVLGEFIETELKVPVWYDGDRLRLTTLRKGTNNGT